MFIAKENRKSNFQLFEVFRGLVRSVEWSGVSGVDSPGYVPGPPQRQRSSSARRVRTSTTGCL